MNFSDLSVVILTRNREKYLIRNVKYWSNTNAKIIVADGSDESLKSRLSEFNESLIYIHCKDSPEHRLYLAGQFIESPFTIIVADDDLLLFSGIKKCIDFLYSNPSYVSALGTALSFEKNGSSVSFFDLYPENIEFGNVSHENCWDRSDYHLSNYAHTTMYAVLKSDVFINLSKSLKGITKLDGNLLELIIEYCISYSGKTMVIDEITWLRGNECPPNWKAARPTIAWFLSLANKERGNLLAALDQNILSIQSSLPRKIRKLIFLKTMVKHHLKSYCSKLGIDPKYRWLIFPIIFIHINTLYLFKNKLKKRITESSSYVGKGRTANKAIKTGKESSLLNSDLDSIIKVIAQT